MYPFFWVYQHAYTHLQPQLHLQVVRCKVVLDLLQGLQEYGDISKYNIIQCEAPKIAQLVYNSNNYGLWYL